MPHALKDGARATVNGEVREFARESAPERLAVPVLRPTRGPVAPAAPAARPLVSVSIAPDLRQLLETAQRVGVIGEKAADMLGKVGIAAAVGLVAYGGYRWYKSQQPARPRQRKLRAELLPGGSKR